MLWSGSSPLTVVRDGMWGFLLFAGVAWLAVAWSVLRLEPADLATVVGPVILFGAVTEAVRTLAGTRTWWLNAGMALVFAATGVLLLRDMDSSWTTPAALIGWYLLVRGAADVAVSMLSRETDRIWGLLLVVGLVEVGLGFFSASSLVRTPELVVLVLGGAGVARGVADLVASLRLREASLLARAGRLLELSPERAIGVAGYSAGLIDFEAGSPARGTAPRHRATPRASAGAMADLSTPGPIAASVSGTASGAVSGAASGAASGGEQGRAGQSGSGGPQQSGPEASWSDEGWSHQRWTDQSGAIPGGSTQAGAGRSGSGQGGSGGSFHDEVLRTTADLDAMLALAGVTGAAVPGAAAVAAAQEHVEVPDTAESMDLPAAEDAAAAAAVAQRQSLVADDRTLPLLDPVARVAESTAPGLEDTSIIARSRLVD